MYNYVIVAIKYSDFLNKKYLAGNVDEYYWDSDNAYIFNDKDAVKLVFNNIKNGNYLINELLGESKSDIIYLSIWEFKMSNDEHIVINCIDKIDI